MSIEHENQEQNENVMRIKKLLDEWFNELNHMGNEENIQIALQLVLNKQHRTLQQSFFKQVVITSISIFADKKRANAFDLRNEASCELAEKLQSVVKDCPIPFV